jgi:hypothetical protein
MIHGYQDRHGDYKVFDCPLPETAGEAGMSLGAIVTALATVAVLHFAFWGSWGGTLTLCALAAVWVIGIAGSKWLCEFIDRKIVS